MSGVDQIISYQKSDDEDYYKILGCTDDSTIEQINTEYKIRALQFHPDKNEGNKDAEEKFQKLQEAKEILSDPEKRKIYDKWRTSGISISFKQWTSMKDNVQQTLHWANVKTKDRMLPPTGGTSSGPSSLNPSQAPAAHRRASEGGANLYRGNVWGTEAPSEVINKFRNYEI